MNNVNIVDLYRKRFTVSIEIFPPKTDEGEKNLWRELSRIKKIDPGFISVTYGAGGSTREKTLDIALDVKNNMGITPLVHFTCVGSPRKEIESFLNMVKDNKINNIMALRGDPPAGHDTFKPHPEGFAYANELVEFIRSVNGFTIAVAGYPEGHTEAPDLETDIVNLKKKVDAGADLILTQLFFNNNHFYDFMDRIEKAGISIPVVPGIMPITGLKQITRINDLSGADIPPELMEKLRCCDTEDQQSEAGIEFSMRQCSELRDWGVPGIHLYTLNRARAALKIAEHVI